MSHLFQALAERVTATGFTFWRCLGPTRLVPLHRRGAGSYFIKRPLRPITVTSTYREPTRLSGE